MQRIYIYIIIAAIVFAASYSPTIKKFFTPGKESEKLDKPVSAEKDDGSERLELDLYRMAQTFSDLQGKTQLLKMAQEKREWFTPEDYARLDMLLERTQKDLAEAELLFKEAQEEYARIAVKRMLDDYTRTQEQ